MHPFVFPSSTLLLLPCVYARGEECLLFVLLPNKSSRLLGSLPCSVHHFSSGAEASDNLISYDLTWSIPLGTEARLCVQTLPLCAYLANYQPLKASYEKLGSNKITDMISKTLHIFSVKFWEEIINCDFIDINDRIFFN